MDVHSAHILTDFREGIFVVLKTVISSFRARLVHGTSRPTDFCEAASDVMQDARM